MASYNKVQLIGNLTRDPEMKYTGKGTAVANTALAINENYTDDSGQKMESTIFIDITAWQRTAEILCEYCKKGSLIFVEGKLKMDSWDDKQTGAKRTKITVTVLTLQLIGGREAGGEGGGNRGGQGGGYEEGGEHQHGGGQQQQRQQTGGGGFKKSPPPQRNRPPADPDLSDEGDDIPF